MKNKFASAACAVLMAAAVFSQTSFAQAKYVGVKPGCACHTKNGVLAKWQSSDHSKAFETLKSDKAKEVGKKLGVADPSTSEKCLSCHVTNGGKGVTKKEEGVTCEACHGPGSDYKDMKVMKNHDEAVKKGLIMGKGDEKLCKTCHNPKSPTYKPFDYAKKFAAIKH